MYHPLQNEDDRFTDVVGVLKTKRLNYPLLAFVVR
jgi:hypothetical protein